MYHQDYSSKTSKKIKDTLTVFELNNYQIVLVLGTHKKIQSSLSLAEIMIATGIQFKEVLESIKYLLSNGIIIKNANIDKFNDPILKFEAKSIDLVSEFIEYNYYYDFIDYDQIMHSDISTITIPSYLSILYQ